jgi:Protein of unknown function (DUF3237)
MKLDFLMEYTATLRTPAEMVGTGPSGNRIIVSVTGGEFEGPKLRGKVLPTGADWVRLVDGVTHLDVRATFETDDGAFIYVQYFGVSHPIDGKQAPPPGQGTEYGDAYFMTSPRFETGDERYKWLNDLVTVGEGKRTPDGGVAYRVYAVVN